MIIKRKLAILATGCLGGRGISSSLGRYVFGSEISYNKAPPRLPGLAY
jgi:hypothetical protein